MRTSILAVGLGVIFACSAANPQGLSRGAKSVSAYSVVASPNMYNNSHISLLLYYSNVQQPMFFVNKEAADNSDTASAIGFCGTVDPMAKRFLDKKGERSIYVEGVFSSKKIEFDFTRPTAGCFAHIVRIGGRGYGGKWSELRESKIW